MQMQFKLYDVLKYLKELWHEKFVAYYSDVFDT